MEAVLSLLLLLAALAVCAVRGCQELQACQKNNAQFEQAQKEGDMAAMCRLLGESVLCKERALGICELRGAVSADRLVTSRRELELGRRQIGSYCPGEKSSSVANGTAPRQKGTATTCLDMMSCMFDPQVFQQAMNRKLYSKACGMIRPSVSCLRSALADCRRHNILEGDGLDNATSSLADSEALLEEYCGRDIANADHHTDDTGNNANISRDWDVRLCPLMFSLCLLLQDFLLNNRLLNHFLTVPILDSY